MLIRDATPDDWPGVWAFMQPIVAAGETYCVPTDLTEQQAREWWFRDPPARVLVAVGDGDALVGTALVQPNHDGPGDHVANAGFMVDPAAEGHGVGRALAERAIDEARADGYLAMQFDAVVETNSRAIALWRSLGFDILCTAPGSFRHPTEGYVGLHIMHRRL